MTTSISRPAQTSEAKLTGTTRRAYLQGALQGAHSTKTALNKQNEDGEIKPTISRLETGELLETWPDECNPENSDPGEYANADAMRRRYQHMSRNDLYDRVLALEGYVFGATGQEAPKNI